MKKKNLVIIGGGGGGLFSGAVVKQMSKEFEVHLISDEDLLCRCSIPYVVSKKAELKDTIIPDEMITNFGIKLIKGRATNIDKKLKIIDYEDFNSNSNGKIIYDVLVIATGARAFMPPIKGNELKNVYSVRSVDDLKNINSSLSKTKSALVIGGGVIGVEMASALKERGIKSTLMIIEDKPFPRIADFEFRDLIKLNLEEKKVNLITEASIKRIIGDKKVKEVIYEKDGKYHTLKTDLLIFATGVRSNVDLFKDLGIKMNRFGILVDDYMRTNIKNIYAVGDVAVAKNYVSKLHTPSQLATNAVIQGKITGRNIAGFKTKYMGHTSAMILQFLGDEFGSAGENETSCKLNNIEYLVGKSHSTDIYKDLKGAHEVFVKLIFRKKDLKIIGVQAYGRNVVWIINLISFAIQKNSTLNDLMNFDYASHPSMSPWPFMDPIVDACEHVLMKLNSKK